LNEFFIQNQRSFLRSILSLVTIMHVKSRASVYVITKKRERELLYNIIFYKNQKKMYIGKVSQVQLLG